MSRDKQIKEMAKAILEVGDNYDTCCEEDCETIASLIYNADYRKVSEVAREIFNDIENAIGYDLHSGEELRIVFALSKLNEVKRKYLDEDFFIKMTHTCPHIIPDLVTSISDTAFRHPLTESQYTSEQIRRNGVESRLRKGRK